MEFIQSFMSTFELAAPFILVGLFLSGLIQAFITPTQITRFLGHNQISSVLWAAIAGIPLPLCSCGVIPAAVTLRQGGASRGAVTSFLIATPETGVDSMLLSFALLDPLMAIFRPLAALATAIAAGILVCFYGEQEKDEAEDEKVYQELPLEAPVLKRLQKGLWQSFVKLLGDISPWFILGLVLSTLITHFVPASYVSEFLGPGLSSMFLALLIGIPLYICASASTPLVAALILKGMAPGAALVFLLVGPATNITTITMVARFLGLRTAVIYVLSIAGCALFFGALLNGIYVLSGTNMSALLTHASECVGPLNLWSSLALSLLMAHALWQKFQS